MESKQSSYFVDSYNSCIHVYIYINSAASIHDCRLTSCLRATIRTNVLLHRKEGHHWIRYG